MAGCHEHGDKLSFSVNGEQLPTAQGVLGSTQVVSYCACMRYTFLTILFYNLCPQTMTDVVGNPEEERRSDFFYQPWAQEAVCRYFYTKVQQKRAELEQALGIRNA